VAVRGGVRTTYEFGVSVIYEDGCHITCVYVQFSVAFFLHILIPSFPSNDRTCAESVRRSSGNLRMYVMRLFGMYIFMSRAL